MPSVYELEASYPVEIRVGRRFVSALEREFKVKLPKGEVQGVAMHFINARNMPPDETTAASVERQFEEILKQTTQIIEWEMNIRVRRDTFAVFFKRRAKTFGARGIV